MAFFVKGESISRRNYCKKISVYFKVVYHLLLKHFQKTVRTQTYRELVISRYSASHTTGLQLVKKVTKFYETLRFMTAFTNARPLSLS
jgi:hypothetical protein